MLWQKGGANALTMRAIAKATGSNTPTIYRRFKNRDDIVFALAQRVQQDIVKTLQLSRSPEETCAHYIEFASGHPHEYSLFLAYPKGLWQPVRSRDQSALRNSTPFVELIRKQLAERLDGSIVEHTRLSLALWTLAHGAAALLISEGIPTQQAGELRSAFAAAANSLICRRIFADNDLWAG
jgi:AcrR family transcriptional regulator